MYRPVGAANAVQLTAMTIVPGTSALLPHESVTKTTKEYVPASVGVPEMTPVSGSSVRPGGKIPEDSA
jgi:hypothetical protein